MNIFSVDLSRGVITFRSEVAVGIIGLTSLADNSSGVNATNTYTKTFRYSTNGITYTDWQPLTLANILAVQVASDQTLIIEIQFRPNPSDSTSLSASVVTIGTNEAPVPKDSDLFKNTIFAQFFGSYDLSVLDWMLNVLDKLFKKGLIPNYIERFNDNGSPEDFIEFWGAVCKFFAYYVIYARKYQNFYENRNLISEYLEERGLKTSQDNDEGQMQEMMSRYYYEIASRGTRKIVGKTGENGNDYDGELLRLINFQAGDEFLFNLNKSEHAGWNINNSSPMYRSVTAHDNINKWYEQGEEPSDITKYPKHGSVSIIADDTIGKNVLSIGTNSKIGQDFNYKIPVDPSMDYEFSFFIKKTDSNNLIVGIDAYDENGFQVDLQYRCTGLTSNQFVLSQQLQRSDKYLYLRFFLYNKLKPIYINDNLNLRMVSNVKYVVPRIEITVDGSATVYNVRFLPMALPYSKGFVQINNFIDCFIKNNYNRFTLQEVNNYIRKYLIPYNSHIKLIEVDKGGDVSLEEDIIPTNVVNLPTVLTLPAESIVPSGAKLGGNVTDDGGGIITERGIVWSSTEPDPTIADNRIALGAGIGIFQNNVGALTSGLIYVKAYAINLAGIAYGETIEVAIPIGISSITLIEANPSNAALLKYRVIFTDNITGLAASNFDLMATGTIAGTSIVGITNIDNKTFDVQVNTGTGDGTLALRFTNDTGLSLTISNKPFTGQIYTIDKTAPTASIDSSPSNLSNTKNPTFTFSGTDTGGSGLAGLLVSIDGGAYAPASSPLTYNNLSEGNHTFSVKAVDNAGNMGSPAIYSWNIDSVAPNVVSIVRQTPPDATINTDDPVSVTFRITFSENVSGVDISDFFLTKTGSVTGVKSTLTPVSPSIYDMLVTGVHNSGTIRLDLQVNGTGIQDLAGNPIVGGFNTGQAYTLAPITVANVVISLIGIADGSGATPVFYVKAHATAPIDNPAGLDVNYSYQLSSGGRTIGGTINIPMGFSESDFVEVVTGGVSDTITYYIDSLNPITSGSQNYSS